MNERGNSTFTGIIILLILAILSIDFYKMRVQSHKQLKDKQDILLCAKKLNGLLSEYVDKMENTNKALMAISLGKKVSHLNPVFKIFMMIGGNLTILGLKAYQKKAGISLMKKQLGIFLKSCKFAPFPATTTPYRSMVGFYKRDKFERAIKDKKVWRSIIWKGKFRIKNIYSFKKNLKTKNNLRIRSKLFEGKFSSISPFF